MKAAVAWFAKNSIAANLLMAVILGAGFLALPNIREEVVPELDPELISVTVPYLGAAPEEVEKGVCARIEEAVADLVGVKKISSTAAEGIGTVLIEVLEGTEPRELLDDVKNRVDSINTFPQETEQPIAQHLLVKRQVINVAVSGPANEKTLKTIGERIRDELAALPGIIQVDLASARPYEVSIEVAETALRRNGLTFAMVANAVRRSSLDLPGGSVRTVGGEILLRSKGQAYVGEDFENLILLSRPDGTRILLGDVATVVDGFAETDQASRFDGNPAVLITVFRVGEQSAIDIAEAVKIYVKGAQDLLPDGIMLTTWSDRSQVLKSRLELLTRNARTGFVLVVISLTLFLRLGLAFWASVGIPISFLGAIIFMPHLGVSINLLSLFAFIVVLGIVVDDAIIVGENIFRHHEAGEPALDAAIRGTQEVLVPVIFGVLTSVAAFSPMLVLGGVSGQMFRVIPLVVIPTLIFSLIESLFILPAHLSHLRRQPKTTLGLAWDRFQSTFTRVLKWVVDHPYGRLLDLSLEWRYLTVSIGVLSLLLSLGIWFGGWIKFRYLPDVEADNVVALLTMPQGTPPQITDQALKTLERSAQQVRREVEGEGTPVFVHTLTSIGAQPFLAAQFGSGAALQGEDFSGSHLGEINIQLVTSEDRTVSSLDIGRRWRELTPPIPDAVELTFSTSLIDSGEDVNVQLTSRSLEDLEKASEDLKQYLGHYAGVDEISDSLLPGKQEVKLSILPAAETLGLTLEDLSRQVRQAFYGAEAQRIQRGRDEVKVMVRYPASQRRSLSDLETMRIRTPLGDEVPFSLVADLSMGRGPAEIRRVNRNRAVNVTADVDETQSNANEIIADLELSFLPELARNYPGLNFSFEGEQRTQRDTLEGLSRGFSIALLAIFALLAVPLRSYLQPIIIMSLIPFGLVGAVLGHLLLGIDLTIISMYGIVALAGVVINDSLILVDYVNRRRREGLALWPAVRRAGRARFRPILLTSVTTFLGLTPLLLEKSIQAQFLIPMAVSLAFGVVFATVIALLFLPSAYLILEDLTGIYKWLFGGESGASSLAETASSELTGVSVTAPGTETRLK